jgi:hypothetical protein
MLKTILQDGRAGNTATVSKEGAVKTTLSPTLGIEDDITATPFIRFLTINNDGATNNLNVDGSVISIDAYVEGNNFGDFYITTANIVIADDSPLNLNGFGGLPELTNGVQFFYQTASDSIPVAFSLTTNYDMIRLGTLTHPIGGKTDAYQISKVDSAGNDGYNPIWDLARYSPFGLGLRLRKNTKDRIGITIRDDLTGLSSFNMVVSGFLRVIRDGEE